jgi:hypothetical protein
MTLKRNTKQNAERRRMRLEVLRKELNPRQQALRQALTGEVDEKLAVQRFLELLGILHSRQVAPEAPWSYEDLILADLEASQYRLIPAGEEHSIAWILWRLSRIEDVTMNLLVAGDDQIFEAGGWLDKTKSPIKHTGNGTGIDVAKALSAALDIPALGAYRHAVGGDTREIVHNLTKADYSRKVDPQNLQRVVDEGAEIQAGYGVVEYWGRRDVAGLLLMPPTRHTIVHWNEARRLIKQLRKSR